MAISQFPPLPNLFQRSQLFTTSGTFVHPDGYGSSKTVLVIACGGGGGGGSGGVYGNTGVAGIAICGGAGGGSGFVQMGYLTIAANQTVTIGAGGTGGAVRATTTAGSGNTGNAGGDTSFGSLTARGGRGGSGGTAASTGRCTGGAGGSAGGCNFLAGAADDKAQTAATNVFDGRAGGEYGTSKVFGGVTTVMFASGQNQSGFVINSSISNALVAGNNTIASMVGTYISGGGGVGGSGYNSTTAYNPDGNPAGSGFYGSGGAGGAGDFNTGTTPATGTAGANATGYGAGGGGGGIAGSIGTPSSNSTSGAGGNGTDGYVLVFY